MEHSKKPVIVLAHRGLDLLNSAERKKLLNIFKDYNVCLYLCGHSHDLWCEETYPIPQITVGCIKQDEGVKVGFSVGKFDESINIIEINAYSWENDCWREYSHFCSQGNKLSLDISDKVSLNEDEFINKIKIVINGKVQEFIGKVIEMNHSINSGSVISTVEGSLIFKIKNNAFTKQIKFNDKFILSQNVWKIIGVDNTAKHTITVTCKKELINSWNDDMENEIANKNNIVE